MAPLVFNENFRGGWTCCTCVNDFDATDLKPWTTASEDLVCVECIRERFNQAFSAGLYRPPTWGSAVLRIDDFAEHLSASFVQRIRDGEAQYEREANLNRTAPVHVPRGFRRGVDAQQCPNRRCRALITLSEGCHHVDCRCGTQFCFVCGQEMLGDAGHFGPAGCPRYGNAMTESRIYDPSPENEEYGFSFEHTAWAVAMQTSDRGIRDVMRALLAHQFPVLTEDLAIDALGAMIHFHPVHAVSEESWLDRVRQEVNYLLNFLEEPLLPDASRPGPQPWPLLNGYLQHRVGGYFNVVNYASRQEALRWAEARIEDWSDEEKHSRHNFAVFDLGPGGEEDDRKDAFDLQCFLMEAGTRMTQRRLRFHDMNANALLVQVVGEPDSSTLVARSRPLGRWDALDRFRRLLLGYDYSTGLRQRIADAHHELVDVETVPYEDRDAVDDDMDSYAP